MEFLYKLYDKEYFGIMLFILITVLLLLFLIILFFGKKDEKKRLEETKKLEFSNTDAFKEVDDNTRELKIPEIEQPKVEEVKEKSIEDVDNPVSSSDEKINTDVNDSGNVQSFIPDVEIPNVTDDNDNNIDLTDLFDVDTSQQNGIKQESELNDLPKKAESFPMAFELPKMAEMPKLKEEKSTNVLENVEQAGISNIFDNIESETYDIKQ